MDIAILWKIVLAGVCLILVIIGIRDLKRDYKRGPPLTLDWRSLKDSWRQHNEYWKNKNTPK